MSKLYPTFLKRLTICLKRPEKFGFPMIFLNLCTKSQNKLTISKSKLSRLSYIFIETVSLLIDKFKSKNAALVSEAFALFS